MARFELLREVVTKLACPRHVLDYGVIRIGGHLLRICWVIMLYGCVALVIYDAEGGVFGPCVADGHHVGAAMVIINRVESVSKSGAFYVPT